MKKIFLTAALLFGLVNIVSADPIGFGIKGGVNMANQVYAMDSYNSGLNTDVIFGLVGGVFMDADLNNFLSLQPEVNFTMKGYQQKNAHVFFTSPSSPAIAGYSDVSLTFTYNYLEIPLLLQFNAHLAPGLKGSLLVGPSVALLLNANGHYTGTITGDSPIRGSNLDFGMVLGAGMEIDKFLLDVRYGLGLTSVTPFPGGPQNSVLSLDVGYRIQ